MISDHDPALIQKIARIRLEYWRVRCAEPEAGAEPPPEMRNMRAEEAPEIIALFNEYGRDAVRAA